MKLWIVSDLHVESAPSWDLPPIAKRPTFDVMIVAGDLIPRMERGVKWLLSRITEPPVIYIAGNHEFYGTDIDRTVEKARREANGTNIHVLQNESVTIGTVTFLGATGWTDFNFFGDPDRAMRVAQETMNDYRKIRTKNFENRLRPTHALTRHLETRMFLQQGLRRPAHGRLVVITHMGFHAEAVRPDLEHDVISAAYTSRALIEGADLWVYGHTHESRDFLSGNTRVVSNAKGYGPWRANEKWENPKFDPIFTVEI
jgi:predicted phosphodiesterase